MLKASLVYGQYEQTVDRESAYEKLKGRTTANANENSATGPSMGTRIKDALGGVLTGSGRKDSLFESMAKSAARTIGSQVGREIIRGVLGSLLGRRR